MRDKKKQSIDNESLKYYIQEITSLIKDNAKRAKVEADFPKDGDSPDFNTGFLMAYYQVITIMKNQASFFNLKQIDLGLADIEPERDLL